MGARCRFACGSCGYAAEVSGQDDAGLCACTSTMVCDDCRELYDIVTDKRASESEPFQPCQPRCPRAPHHRLRAWNVGDACPRCGGAMENEGGTLLWD